MVYGDIFDCLLLALLKRRSCDASLVDDIPGDGRTAGLVKLKQGLVCVTPTSQALHSNF